MSMNSELVGMCKEVAVINDLNEGFCVPLSCFWLPMALQNRIINDCMEKKSYYAFLFFLN
jgi:hypothetical protein